MSRTICRGLCASIVILSAGPLDAQFYPVHHSPPAEGPYFNPATGHWYTRLSELAGYSYGQAISLILGGTIVAINDAGEQQWLLDTFGADSVDTYIGLFRAGPTWQWESGEPVTFTDWAPGEPAPFSLHTKGIAGWQGTNSSSVSRAIVECVSALGDALPGFTCTPMDPDIQLTWGPSGYDTVLIYRNLTLIATVPASALGYVDPALGTGAFREYLLVGESTSEVSVPVRCTCALPDGDYTLRIPDASGLHPGPISVPVLLDHPAQPAQAVVMSLCFDTTAVEAVSVVAGAAVLEVTGPPDYFDVVIEEDGLGFFMWPCAVPPTCVIGPGVDHEIAVVSLQAIAPPPISEPLQICSLAGMPPFQVAVAIFGASIAPVAIDGSIQLEVPGFIRGDANYDASFDIADVVFLGDLLFGAEGPAFPCREACEVNGDAVIDIADMVTILGNLFFGGPPPGEPFPECGPDPDPASGWGCDPAALCL